MNGGQEQHGQRSDHGGTWHVSGALAARYVDGGVLDAEAWSVEKHVEGCPGCAARVSAAAREGSAAALLADVRTELLSTALAKAGTRTEVHDAEAGRAPQRLRGARATTRILWAAGPAVRGSWLVGVVLVAVAALVLAHGAGLAAQARPLLLVLAPALPVIGVALSYGPRSDPLHEITVATGSGGLRLLLTRTVAVLVVSVPLLTAVGALLPSAPGVPGAATWLLPALALTTATLALGSFTGCRPAAAVLGGAWLAAAFLPSLSYRSDGVTDRLSLSLSRYATEPAQQAGWAVAALLCAALVAVRRSSFDHLERT
ncbi:zf-HC2 domain-containing protein [Streptomyces sp. NPDC059578]|uniref:zf-HC2 domain-containing protein n=1 Tax=Streptomyces sp. NPDC059578 TaxID=3346874 RepID=UPI0036CF3E86